MYACMYVYLYVYIHRDSYIFISQHSEEYAALITCRRPQRGKRCRKGRVPEPTRRGNGICCTEQYVLPCLPESFRDVVSRLARRGRCLTAVPTQRATCFPLYVQRARLRVQGPAALTACLNGCRPIDVLHSLLKGLEREVRGPTAVRSTGRQAQSP